MKAEEFAGILGSDFYTGVPDSQLKALCSYLDYTYGSDPAHHVIAANEGNAAAIAAGYHLATGRVPVVYMQNSGEGNIINPAASLLNKKVYGIPVIFVIGWRGEPGVHDEPQHIFQGEVTCRLLADMGIEYFILDGTTKGSELEEAMRVLRERLDAGKDVAIVVRKGALEFDGKPAYGNSNTLIREEIIEHIVMAAGSSPIVSTTGKASRELFEIRERRGEGHEKDFLTVGSMGHSSSIAMGIALCMPKSRIWCIDGDGAMIMHMGALAVIGNSGIGNLVHVMINNAAHETVGGMPTAGGSIDPCGIAKACGYKKAVRVSSMEELDRELAAAAESDELCFIEVLSGLGSRADLGRPTVAAAKNKEGFMEYLAMLK